MEIKQRIGWVDIAKALTIIFMIIGHTNPISGIRNFIFSFHMPLFILLTGYTIKPVRSLSQIKSNIIKDFRRLMIPAFLTQILSALLMILIKGESVQTSISIVLKEFYYAFPDASTLWLPIWFLIATFWTKLIYYFIEYFFTNRSYIAVLLLGLGGGYFGTIKFLPQDLDVVFVMVIFLYAGTLLNRYSDIIVKYEFPITILSFIYWSILLFNNMYVELISRYYPYFMVSILEAIAGSFCVIVLAKAIDKNNKLVSYIKDIGKHTLLILCVHQLDVYIQFVWTRNVQILTIASRIIIDLIIVYLILFFKSLITKKRKKQDMKMFASI